MEWTVELGTTLGKPLQPWPADAHVAKDRGGEKDRSLRQDHMVPCVHEWVIFICLI